MTGKEKDPKPPSGLQTRSEATSTAFPAALSAKSLFRASQHRSLMNACDDYDELIDQAPLLSACCP